MLFWELSESEELPDPLDEDEEDPEDEDVEEVLEPEVLLPALGLGGIFSSTYPLKITMSPFDFDIS